MWFFFLETVLWEDVLLRTDLWYFPESSLEKTCDILLEWMLERTWDVWKGCSRRVRMRTLCGIGSPCHSLLVFLGICWHCSLLMVLCGMGSPCHSLLVIVCDITGRNATIELLVVFQQPLAAFTDSGQLAELIVSSGSSCYCWFVWTELLISWQCRLDLLQRTIF